MTLRRFAFLVMWICPLPPMIQQYFTFAFIFYLAFTLAVRFANWLTN